MKTKIKHVYNSLLLPAKDTWRIRTNYKNYFVNNTFFHAFRKTSFVCLVLTTFLIASITTPGSVNAQNNLTINQCDTVTEVIALVDSVLLFGLHPSQFKNITFTGNPGSVGYFSGGYIFGFNKPQGIVMSTGFAGEQDQSNVCSGFLSGTTGGGSDADLSQLSGNSINDACVIEFDFKLTGDSINFDYTFGSEEYHEWVAPLFADVFGLFLSGPGINGPFSNDAINIAVVPETNDPVSIGNLNCGDQDAACTPPPGNGPNCELLIDNGDNSQDSFGQFALDAFTVPLVADEAIQQCVWYHVKIAIGDASDAAYDSGIFLEKGSFNLDGDSLSITIEDSSYCKYTTLYATPGFESYLWNTGDTTANITISEGGEYSVIASNSSSCYSEAEFNAPAPLEPYQFQKICMVSLDTNSNLNEVVVEIINGVGIDSVLFYKQIEDSSGYEFVGAIDAMGAGIFVDTTTNPGLTSQRYKISIKDTCDNISDLSPHHRTIHLQVSPGTNNDVNLTWNPYEGFTYNNFEIYRSVNDSGLVLIDTIPNNTFDYHDTNLPDYDLSYQIRVNRDPACGSGMETYAYTGSNIVILIATGLTDNYINGIKVYPNPLTSHTTFSYQLSRPGQIHLKIYNQLGVQIEDIHQSHSSPGQYNFKWDASNYPAGIYYYRLESEIQFKSGRLIITN